MCLWIYIYFSTIFRTYVLTGPEHTQNTYPRRRSQMLAVLLTSLHSGPPLTTPINSVKVNPPNLLVHRWGPGQHTDNWPAPFRPGQWCWAERSSAADAETLNKWTWPAGVGGSAILVYAGLSWEMGLCDAEIVSSIRQWQKERERSLDL